MKLKTVILAIIIFLGIFIIYLSIQIALGSNAVEIEDGRHPEEPEPVLID